MLRSVCLLSTLVLTFVLAQEECFRSKDGVDYRGKVNVTLTGKTCQYWGAQTPHSHRYGYLYTERNYCRNPDHEPKGTWCYTVDKAKRWEYCNVTKCTQPFNPCYSTPCQNGGTCTVTGSNKRKYACTCPSQWIGTQCESEALWKSCDSQPCQNGGTCLESKFSFTCVCAPSWIGKFCNVQRVPHLCDGENGWTLHGDYCYRVYDSMATWDYALSLCKYDFADLVQITSESIQKIAHNISKQVQADLWMGTKLNAGKWVNSEYEAFGDKTYWKSGVTVPNKGEACVALDNKAPATADWYTAKCDMQKYFVCQKTKGSCPDGYYYSKNRCYLFQPHMLASWNNAKKFCEGLNTRLIDIYDKNEQLFVNNLCLREGALKKKVWLGLQVSDDNRWTWGSSKMASYTNWFNDTSSTYDCAYFDIESAGKWYDSLPCITPLSVLCVVDAEDVQWPDTHLEGSDNSSCGSDWDYNQNTGYCYKVDFSLETWTEAQEACKKDGAELVSIGSLEEQSFIAGLLQGYYLYSSIWIGANSHRSGEGWSWSDGTPFAFYNWFPGDPDNDVMELQECVSIFAKYVQWADNSCNQLHPYMCKKKAQYQQISVTPTALPVTKLPPAKTFYCPSGWIEYNNKCFLVVREKKSWFDANQYCSKAGGNLTSIPDANYHNFIFSQLPNEYCFNLHPNDSHCNELVAAGKCKSDPLYMARTCQAACKLCIRNCRDFHSTTDCQKWARLQNCTVNSDWMITNCAMSCGVCDYAVKGGFWIGLNDRLNMNTFRWTDGQDVSFTLWAQNQPDGAGSGFSSSNRQSELCVVMSLMDGKWFDTSCDAPMAGFICRKEKDSLQRTTQSPLQLGCPEKTLAYDAYCYGYSEDKKTWTAAQGTCNQANGSLATIDDRYLQAFLSSELVEVGDPLWIGLYQNSSNNYWINTEPVRFTLFERLNQNINQNIVCGVIDSAKYGMWSLYDCSTKQKYLCQYPRSGYTTTTIKTTTVTTPAPTCPTGWTERNDQCYKYYNTKQSWADARWSCRQIGADLVKIKNQIEFNMVYRLLNRLKVERVWVGLNDRASENAWKWSDGSAVTFTKWANSQPDDYYSNEDCGELIKWASYRWNDNMCSVANPFMCQVNKGIPVKETIPDREASKCLYKDFYYHKNWCYFVKTGNAQFNYYQAERFCNAQGAHLTSIHSLDESNFIVWLMTKESKKNNIWIGLTEMNPERQYRWSDGSALDYIAWHKNEPNDGGGEENCVRFGNMAGRWHDYPCSSQTTSFVCKKRNESTVITTTTPVPRQGGCPLNFINSPINDKCYYIGSMVQGDTKVTWDQSFQKCKQFGKEYSLLSIKDSNEQEFITSLMRGLSGGIWNGFFSGGSNKYRWIDNSEITFTNWKSGQPTRAYGRRCISMWTVVTSGQWKSNPCNQKLGYICQTYKDPKYPTLKQNDCPPGFTKHSIGCYKFISMKLNYQSARKNCERQNASLVSISNRFENAYVTTISVSQDGIPFWIGLSTTAKSNTVYSWDDGTPYIYEKWAPGCPSLTKEKDCVLFHNRTWKDTSCDLELASVCEISLVNISTRPAPSCPKHAFAFDSSCYYLEKSKTAWNNANKTCKMMGMDLVSIHSTFEMEHIHEFVLKQTGWGLPSIWIGLSRLPVPERLFREAGWYWSDGSDYNYNNFAVGQPSESLFGTYRQCVVAAGAAHWNDMACNTKHSFMCKETVSVTTGPIRIETTENTKTTIEETTENAKTTTEVGSTESILNITVKYASITKDNQDSKVPALGVVGIVVGILLVILISVLIFLLLQRRYRTHDSLETASSTGFENALYKGKDEILMGR